MPAPVSILLPVLNEADFIDACIESLTAQDYAGPIEIVVADGGSTDGTRERLQDLQTQGRLVLVDNPDMRQWAGLNRAAAVATGEVLVRADGHSTYEPDYVSTSVNGLRESGATAVGGRMIPESDTPVGQAIAAAMANRMAVGPARYRHQQHRSEVDTVYLGAFLKSDFERLGGYRDLPGVAEDADLYYRWRTEGATIVLDPAIRSTYRPRDTWRALARQYFRYGWGKADMVYANLQLPSWRPLVPLALVMGLIGATALAALGRWWPLLIILVSWAAVLFSVAARAGNGLAHRLRTLTATAIMQLAYGLGLLGGLVRGPGSRKHLRS